MKEFTVREMLISILNSISVYLPSWFLGVIIGLGLTAGVSLLSDRAYRWAYIGIASVTFVPVTILLPYAFLWFGLDAFIYPILILPTTVTIVATMLEAFTASNQSRLYLKTNLGMSGLRYWWQVLIPEAAPAIATAGRQSLGLCFAIFLAIDFFLESFGGLGAFASKFYQGTTNHIGLLASVGIVTLLGIFQVAILHKCARPHCEFRQFM